MKNREIKFRCWDGSNMKYFEIPSVFNGEDMLYTKIMQYTGLQDKNGIEIYEGDYIKDEDGEVEVVKWDDNWWENYYHCVGFELPSGRDKLEVIGNIYEHPNLLEEI